MSDSTTEAQIKNALEILKRIDGYVMSTNNKAAIVMSYCAAIVAAISFCSYRVLPSIPASKYLTLLIVLVVVVMISATVSLCLAIKVILPLTFSSAERHAGESLIFFGDIGRTDGGASAYADRYRAATHEKMLNDISRQTFTVSKIAESKFSSLKAVSWILIIGNFVPASAFFILVALYPIFGA
ncbi:hypothetical protein F7R01_10285 [Pseudomonas argentinensis]|uniref:Pycsar system effector family protein n=1 Tax=Phytopseudomonas argentinensis TaxID=289370 RepID=UPI0011143772|nr:Pycsar system effector family protein [Pseudomonas argentinensis]KAB0547879.1 hypothetical protein F7R01_10285 [Pseudomonas argentinensis]